jgi:predicted ATPase
LTEYHEKFDDSKTMRLSAIEESEGTIFLTSIVTAVENSSSGGIILLEEPERYIHPSLIARLSTYLKASADKNQIVITTHNPVFLRGLNREDIFVLERNYTTGVTTLRAPNSDLLDFGLDEMLIDKIL